jgi:hypothetical protein
MTARTLWLVLPLAISSNLTAQQLAITDEIPGTFIDISTTGTPLNLGDDGVAEVSASFDLTQTLFVGDGSGRVWVSNNGAIGFLGSGGSAGAFYLNTPLPDFGLFGGAHGTPQALAVFWDDLDSDTGDVYHATIGDPGSRVLIIQWQDRPHFSGDPVLDGDEVTFQVQIFESAMPGHAQFLYQDVDFQNPDFDSGSSATIGYQAGGIGNDVQWSFNQADAVGASDVLTLISVSCDLPGDVTRDGLRDGDDIGPFVDALLIGPYDECADINLDLLNDIEDVLLFAALLLDG